MIKSLLPAPLLLLAIYGGALADGCPPMEARPAALAGAPAAVPVPRQGGAAPRQGVPAPPRPNRAAPPPPQTAELPEEITLNSICLLDNVYGSPVVFQVELRGSAPQQLGYLDKTVVDVPPGTAGPFIFSVWLKNKPAGRIRCALSRGGSYQVFIKKTKQTQQLAVAPVPGG